MHPLQSESLTAHSRNPARISPYVKCYIADITYYPVEKYKSTVKYGIKYKKYRPIEKYNVLPKDPVAAAKANAKKKERERIENIKYEKWSDKQIRKINKNSRSRTNGEPQKTKAITLSI